jgi:hypothetical protein
MECSQLERFQWDGHSDTFETSTAVLSFVMSQNLQELIIESDPQGCQVLMEKLLYRGNVIRRVNVSHIDLQWKRHYLEESLRHWTHITISEVTLFVVSDILTVGESLTKAVFRVVEGATPTTAIHCPLLQEFEISTSIRTPSLWEGLEANQLQSVQVIFEEGTLNHKLVLDDMAPFLQRHQNLPPPLITPAHVLHSSPLTRLLYV